MIGAHLWATVILAMLRHALQVQVAAENGVPTFDVSLELLWRYLPELAQYSAKHGTQLMPQWCAQISRWLWHWLAPDEEQG